MKENEQISIKKNALKVFNEQVNDESLPKIFLLKNSECYLMATDGKEFSKASKLILKNHSITSSEKFIFVSGKDFSEASNKIASIKRGIKDGLLNIRFNRNEKTISFNICVSDTIQGQPLRDFLTLSDDISREDLTTTSNENIDMIIKEFSSFPDDFTKSGHIIENFKTRSDKYEIEYSLSFVVNVMDVEDMTIYKNLRDYIDFDFKKSVKIERFEFLQTLDYLSLISIQNDAYGMAQNILIKAIHNQISFYSSDYTQIFRGVYSPKTNTLENLRVLFNVHHIKFLKDLVKKTFSTDIYVFAKSHSINFVVGNEYFSIIRNDELLDLKLDRIFEKWFLTPENIFLTKENIRQIRKDCLVLSESIKNRTYKDSEKDIVATKAYGLQSFLICFNVSKDEISYEIDRPEILRHKYKDMDEENLFSYDLSKFYANLNALNPIAKDKLSIKICFEKTQKICFFSTEKTNFLRTPSDYDLKNFDFMALFPVMLKIDR